MTEITRKSFDQQEAAEIAATIGIDFATAEFDLDQFRRGMDVELEHGLRDPDTNVTGNDPVVTGRIAWAHLKEMPDYYDRLAIMEAEAEAEPQA
jgi:hypothetical protein